MWNKIKTLQNDTVTPTKIMFKDQGKYITDHTKVAYTLADNFQNVSIDKYKSMEFNNHKNRKECNIFS